MERRAHTLLLTAFGWYVLEDTQPNRGQSIEASGRSHYYYGFVS